MTPLRRLILLVSLVPLLLVLAGGSLSLAQNDVPIFRHEQPPRRYVCVSIPYHGNLEVAIVTNPATGPFGRVVEREAGYVVLTKQWQPIAGFYAGPIALGGFGVGGDETGTGTKRGRIWFKLDASCSVSTLPKFGARSVARLLGL